MPAKNKKQLALIYAKRHQYGTKEKAPKKWKWVFDSEWGHLKESYSIIRLKDF